MEKATKPTFLTRLKKIFKWWVIVIVLLLVTARLLLPYYVLKYVNKQLKDMKGYTGHVQDIDIWLIRGAYIIDNIEIKEIDTEAATGEIPFFKANAIDLSLEWSSLFKGRIVGKVKMEEPVLNFRQKKVDKTTFKADTADFRQLIRNVMPLTINHFKIADGEVHYIDVYSSPKVDILMTEVSALATNLSNVEKDKTLLPSSIHAKARAYDGDVTLNIKLDPLNKKPTFDMNLELKGCRLSKMNDFMKAYAGVTIDKGTFGLYTELAAKDNHVTGYVKPLLKDLHIELWKEGESLKQKLWEVMVASVAAVFTNQPKDQFATKVQIDGQFNNPDISIWTAIKYMVINAYVQALKPGIDNAVNIGDVSKKETKKSFFDKLFGKKKKK